MEQEKLLSEDSWAVVEVMGHNTFAGRVREHVIGGTAFIRVDVPAIAESKEVQYGNEYTYPAIPAFTKIIGAGSIYAITPCSEEIALKMAKRDRTKPVQILDLEVKSQRVAIPAGSGEVTNDYGHEDDREDSPMPF